MDIDKEFMLNVHLLKRKYIQSVLVDLTQKIKFLEMKKGKDEVEKAKLKKMRQEFVEISREMIS